MKFAFTILLAMTLKMAFAAISDFTLKVEIKGINKKQGFIMAELKDDTGNVLKQVKQDVRASGTVVTFEGLPEGRYAIAVFHDANSDGKLNTNLVGIPSEAYGFSNDARGTFGPPSLADQLVKVDSNQSISIQVK